MEHLMPIGAEELMLAETARELAATNDLTGRYGLSLRPADIESLARHRFETLKKTGRVEFGEGVYKKLIYAFCDSPYLSQENYADTLHELADSFYYFKGEAMERISDDELIGFMKTHFDGECEGSLEYLSGTSLEELCRGARCGYEIDTDGPGRRF